MKKVILFAAVLSAFSFASCKKDHTCTCTDANTSTTTWTAVKVYDNTSLPSQTTTGSSSDASSDAQTITINDAKKKDAKKACISSSSENTDVNVDDYDSWEYNSTTGNYEDYTTTTTTTTVTKVEETCSLN
jgi:hypothetical protein